MAQADQISDETLLAIPKRPEAARLLRLLTPDERNRLEALQQATAQTPSLMDRMRTRAAPAVKQIDTSLARDAEQRANWPADMASRLPRPLQAPVAAGLTFLPVAAESAIVASTAPSLLRGAKALREAVSQPADTILDLLMKKLGADPTRLELAATRLRLQAARSRLRQTTLQERGAAASLPPGQQSENAIINYGKASGIEVQPKQIVIGGTEPDPAALDNYAKSQGSRIIRIYGPAGEQVVGPGPFRSPRSVRRIHK